jgi:hypothetical protein
MPSNKPQFQPQSKKQRKRSVNVIDPKPVILIVCEGTKTEPNYFRNFHVTSVTVEPVGTGRNTISLINEAIKLRQVKKYDQVWCVFDKDDFGQFDQAIQEAKQNGMFVAYSNQSFELWFILHFEYLNSGIERSRYLSKLDQHLRVEYEKNCENMHLYLDSSKRDMAIRNAERLLNEYNPNSRPSNNNPSTTVHELVKILVEASKPLR